MDRQTETLLFNFLFISGFFSMFEKKQGTLQNNLHNEVSFKGPLPNINEANECQKFSQRHHGFWNFHASRDIYIFNQKFYPQFGFYLIFVMLQNGTKINFR